MAVIGDRIQDVHIDWTSQASSTSGWCPEPTSHCNFLVCVCSVRCPCIHVMQLQIKCPIGIKRSCHMQTGITVPELHYVGSIETSGIWLRVYYNRLQFYILFHIEPLIQKVKNCLNFVHLVLQICTLLSGKNKSHTRRPLFPFGSTECF